MKALRCSGCSARYTIETWSRLPLSHRVDAPEVRRVLRDWPDGSWIEARSCRRCASPIALRREQEDADAGVEKASEE
jgi:hypothetical protein